MSFSNSIYEVDLKTHKFCKRCFEKLIKRGITISHHAVL
jgi:predicted Zn-dependent protease